MNSYSTYETPSVSVLTIETEQMFAISSVAEGSGASAGGKIMQNTTNGSDPIWI